MRWHMASALLQMHKFAHIPAFDLFGLVMISIHDLLIKTMCMALL